MLFRSLVSAAAVVIAGGAVGFSQPKRNEIPSFTATRSPTKDNTGTTVLFEVHAKAGTTMIRIGAVAGGAGTESASILVSTDSNGHGSGNLVVPGVSTSIAIVASGTWTNDDKSTLTFTVDLPGTTAAGG